MPLGTATTKMMPRPRSRRRPRLFFEEDDDCQKFFIQRLSQLQNLVELSLLVV